jgi:site-specific recombinase XerD
MEVNMRKYSPKNERIKRQYIQHLKEVRGFGDVAIDQFSKAVDRFETYTKHTDFARFHVEQVRGFKQQLSQQTGARSGEPLSAATIYATLICLRTFFTWLAGQSGYRKRFKYGDWEYFNPSRTTATIAKAHRTPRGPTLDQIGHVLAAMPLDSDVKRRDRALFALIALTGARVNAVASLKLRNIDIDRRVLVQDARTVKTKYSKTFDTWFFPIGDDIEAIVIDWVRYLTDEKQWTLDDPLFPATKLEVGAAGQFEATGLTREHWSGTGPIRTVFRHAFRQAGMPYFNPHSFRNTIVAFGSERNLTWQEMQAWAQNLGHTSLTTTFGSYGQVAPHQQGDLVRNAGKRGAVANPDLQKLMSMVADIHASQTRDR